MTEVLDLPHVVCNLVEQVLLCTHESLAEIHFMSRELPFICELVSYYEIGSIFCSIVNASFVFNLRVHVRKMFRSSAILNLLSSFPISNLMGRIIIQIHLTTIRVITQYILIQLCHLFKLVCVLLSILIELLHDIVFVLKELNVFISHCHEDWRSLNHEADIDSHEVSTEDVEV